MRRLIVIALSLMLTGLQYRLWVADGGIAHTYRLRQQVEQFDQHNQQLLARNQRLDAEVQELKSGMAAMEARARMGLGMVRTGETFYLVVSRPN